MSSFESWGRYPKAQQTGVPLTWRDPDFKLPEGQSLLPYACGRSYGDVCLNDGGTLLLTSALTKLISFDQDQGILRCEPGLQLGELLKFSLPRGWFIPVSPGTQFVSVGGAVANDIHGKNHHSAGTFGRFVRAFELLRSDGSRTVCSPSSNSDLFNATIAGLGLTGLMLWVEVQLKPVRGPWIDMQSVKFRSLDEFFSISSESSDRYEYTVSWLDCVSSGKNFGRGIFMRGKHHDGEIQDKKYRPLPLAVPIDLPPFVLNNLSVRAFNTCYYHKQRQREVHSVVHYAPFFYPLDAVKNWNRIYGKRGFLQFQCVVSNRDDNRATKKILEQVVRSGAASFLAVLKEFGAVPSPGLMSFPRPGVTLCLDLANKGAQTLKLFQELEDLVNEGGGALYPAKDACMQPQSFRTYFPRWQEFASFVDPAFSSSFWRRVNNG